MFEECYEDLANAIIVQAVNDFKPAYKRLLNHPDDKAAARRVKQISKFFRSRYFSRLTTLNGPELLEQIRKEVTPNEVHAS